MVTNQIETNGRNRRLVVDNKNHLKITSSQYPNMDYPLELETVEFKEDYQVCILSNFGERQMLQCMSQRGEKVIFSINLCEKIVSAPLSAKVDFFYIIGEVFIKITDEEKQEIYDEAGNRIASDFDNDITPKFSGCDVIIEKKEKKTGRISFSNLEGCVC